MSKLYKPAIFSLLFFFTISIVFAQNVTIKTEFVDNGKLFKNSNNTEAIAEFKEFDPCIVTQFIGNYTYKVKYNNTEGYVKDRFLLVNEAMMDLYFDYEETQKLKAIKSRGKSDKDLQVLEKIKQDSLLILQAQNKKAKAIEHQKQQPNTAQLKKIQDSITKAKAEEKRLQQIRIQNLKYKQQQDSIAKAKIEALKAQKIKRETEKQKQILDSINIAKAEEIKLEQIRIQNLKYKQQQDSIAKAKIEALKAQQIKRETEKQNQILDSINIAKAEEIKLEQIRIQNLKYKQQQDSIAKAKRLLKDKEIQDAKQAELSLEKQSQIKDSINRDNFIEKRKQLIAEAAKKEQLENLEKLRIKDSITKAKNNITSKTEANTCKYFINEYDSFNKQQLIITEKYYIQNKLNIELIREGTKAKINFNYFEDLGCVDYVPNRRSSVLITLENNVNLKFYHSGSLDCNFFSLKANLNSSQIEALKQSPIKSINLKASKTSVLLTDIDYKNFFIEKLQCLDY